MDQLSRALSETHLRGSLIATLELSAPWSIDFQQSVGVPVHYVIDGEPWLYGAEITPARLTPGDLIMFPRWDRHFMASDAQRRESITISDLVRRNGRTLWSQGQWLEEPLPLVISGSGPRTRLLSMVVELERGAADLLLLSLPRVVRIAGDDADMSAWLAPMLQFLAREEAQHKQGYAIIQSRLAELLFMQIVRSQLLLGPAGEAAALRILLDPAISRAFAALRERPGRRWTLAEMARVGGLSRSAFAERFARIAEMTPFEFLRGLRLDAAAERLKQGEPVKALVEDSGYRTPYSFAKAFRKRFATTPGAYRALFRATHQERGEVTVRREASSDDGMHCRK